MNNKTYKIINTLLYALGFPVLFIIALVKSIGWSKHGMYGAGAFAPLIATIVLWALVGGIQLLIMQIAKKHNTTNKKGYSFRLAAVPIMVIAGVFMIVDTVLPSILNSATSSTILYEDVVEDYQGQHEKLVERVEAFKKKNNLDASVKFEDEEFQKIFAPMFSSMDKAYNSFDPLAIEMALAEKDLLGAIMSGKFPLQVAATLLLRTAPGNENNHNLTLSEIIAKNSLQLLSAVASLKKINFDFSQTAEVNKILNKLLVSKEFDGMKWNILQILGTNPITNSDPNAEIYQTIDGKTEKIGGCLGYQDMSWLNGLPQMFFIPLMSIRNMMYLFASIIALLTVLQCTVTKLFKQQQNQ